MWRCGEDHRQYRKPGGDPENTCAPGTTTHFSSIPLVARGPRPTNNCLVRLKEITQHPYKADCHPGRKWRHILWAAKWTGLRCSRNKMDHGKQAWHMILAPSGASKGLNGTCDTLGFLGKAPLFVLYSTSRLRTHPCDDCATRYEDIDQIGPMFYQHPGSRLEELTRVSGVVLFVGLLFIAGC